MILAELWKSNWKSDSPGVEVANLFMFGSSFYILHGAIHVSGVFTYPFKHDLEDFSLTYRASCSHPRFCARNISFGLSQIMTAITGIQLRSKWWKRNSQKLKKCLMVYGNFGLIAVESQASTHLRHMMHSGWVNFSHG